MPTWTSYVSYDNSCKVWIDTDTDGDTKIEDLVNSDSEIITIDKEGYEDGKDELIAAITPGFRNGKIMLLIARLIKSALT